MRGNNDAYSFFVNRLNKVSYSPKFKSKILHFAFKWGEVG